MQSTEHVTHRQSERHYIYKTCDITNTEQLSHKMLDKGQLAMLGIIMATVYTVISFMK